METKSSPGQMGEKGPLLHCSLSSCGMWNPGTGQLEPGYKRLERSSVWADRWRRRCTASSRPNHTAKSHLAWVTADHVALGRGMKESEVQVMFSSILPDEGEGPAGPAARGGWSTPPRAASCPRGTHWHRRPMDKFQQEHFTAL